MSVGRIWSHSLAVMINSNSLVLQVFLYFICPITINSQLFVICGASKASIKTMPQKKYIYIYASLCISAYLILQSIIRTDGYFKQNLLTHPTPLGEVVWFLKVVCLLFFARIHSITYDVKCQPRMVGLKAFILVDVTFSMLWGFFPTLIYDF